MTSEPQQEAEDQGGWTQAEADEITNECGAPTRWLKAVNSELQFRPDADGDYEVAVCVLEALKASGKAKVGIVGNQKYVTPGESE